MVQGGRRADVPSPHPVSAANTVVLAPLPCREYTHWAVMMMKQERQNAVQCAGGGECVTYLGGICRCRWPRNSGASP